MVIEAAGLSRDQFQVAAQALAVAMFITGTREGRYRLAGLRPSPSVLWVLGGGSRQPLIVYLNRSVLKVR